MSVDLSFNVFTPLSCIVIDWGDGSIEAFGYDLTCLILDFMVPFKNEVFPPVRLGHVYSHLRLVFHRMSRSNSRSILVNLTFGAFLLFCGMEYGKYGMEVGVVLSDVDKYDVSNTSFSTTTQAKSTKEKILECAFPPIIQAQQFLNYGKKRTHCKKMVPFGGPKNSVFGTYYDGRKIVCQDEIYEMDPKNCVVLSFGIDKDWTFDDDMGEFGCKVFSFDPTIGLKDHKRSQNIQFLNLGIGNSNRNQSFKNSIIEIDRYEGILQRLNLTNNVIDYLKMDVEGAEIDVFYDVFRTSPQLLDNVKQIGLELHPNGVSDNGPPTGRMYSYWDHMNILECLGFKLLSWEINMAGPNPYTWRNRQESACYEAVWGRSL